MKKFLFPLLMMCCSLGPMEVCAFEQSAAQVSTVQSERGQTPLEVTLEAHKLWAAGRWAEADELFASVEEHFPPEVRPFGDLLRLLAAERTGKKEEALRRARSLASGADPLAAYYAELARARLGDEPEASLRRALTLSQGQDGRRKSVLKSLAAMGVLTSDDALILAALDGRDPDALARLEQSPSSPERDYRLGWKRYADGQYDRAWDLLSAVPFDSPLGQDAAYYAAVSALKLKQDADALAKLRQILNPEKPKYLTGSMTRLVTLAGRGGAIGKEASVFLGQLTEKNDGRAAAALYAWAISGLPGAQRARSQLIARFPQDKRVAELLWRQGWDAWIGGDKEQAAALWERAHPTGQEESARLLYWRAKAAEAAGKSAEAESLRSQAARHFPLSYYGLVCGGLHTLSDRSLPHNGENELERWGFLTHAKLKYAAQGDFAGALRAAELSLRLGQEGDAYNLLRPWYAKLTGEEASREVLPLLWPMPWKAQVEEGAKRFGTSTALTWAVMRQESAFNPLATSWTGAGGLMQLMPGTAKDEERRIGEGILNRYDPESNIKLGTSHLGWLAKRFSTLREIAAAYNGGSGNVGKWNRAFGDVPPDEWIERIPFEETREYVKKVSANYMIYQNLLERSVPGAI